MDALLWAGPTDAEDVGVDVPDACLMSATVGPTNAFRRVSLTCSAGFLPVTTYVSAGVATPDVAPEKDPG